MQSSETETLQSEPPTSLRVPTLVIAYDDAVPRADNR